MPKTPVYEVVEVVGTSEDSISKAIGNGIAKASEGKSVGVRWRTFAGRSRTGK